ncbi:transporter substrate-binding domain-containing protein [Mitsuaria sp. WAJ17]|uniref:transporter substrate-binding domain-containing protein n=1 Tax=Mitsuaria sp. WAJ17 TaxID=2761452 RepID=UPI00160112C5|nr:transporter substrate-binding domain-containing protein [Mitsuaria sp. WAJ17]MBB2484805.1 transporter substrate-binding domain-containing protein [Mitsuaria sp. WAJ17]
MLRRLLAPALLLSLPLLAGGAMAAELLAGKDASPLLARSETLKRIAATGTINLGHRESSVPFSYYDQRRQVVGYSQDLMLKVVEGIRQELKLPALTQRLVPVTSQNRMSLVQNGTVDLECGSTSNTLARQKQVAFSVSIFIVSTRMLVRRDSPLQEFADLAGRRAVVTAGTTSERLLRAWNETHGGRIQLLSARDHGEAFQSLETGKVDALMLDDALLLGERAKAAQPEDWRLTGTPMSSEVYGCMLRREDTAFKTLVDRELSRLMSNGEALKIYQRWFQRPIPPKGLNLNWPPSDALLQLYRQPSDRALQ